MKNVRLYAGIMALLALAAALGGCTVVTEYPPEIVLRNLMPPEKVEEDETGEEGKATEPNAGSFEAELYFFAQDAKILKVEKRIVEYGSKTGRAEAAILALMDGPSDVQLLERSVPVWMKLHRVEISGDVCNVYMEATYQLISDEPTWLKMRTALAATVAAAEGISQVGVYFYDTEMGYYGYPLGLMSPLNQELNAYYRDMSRTYNMLFKAESGVNITEDTQYLTQSAAFYFTNADRTLLAARSMELTYPEGSKKADIAKMLVEKLAAGDPQGSLEPSLPADFKLLTDPVAVYSKKTETGEDDTASDCVIELTIAPLGAEEYDETIMCGALAMTLTGFIPNVSGVRVNIGELVDVPAETPNATGTDGAAVQDVKILSTIREKTFRRAEFAGIIGHGITLYYPDADGSMLRSVPRIVPQEGIYDPLLRMQEFFSGHADPGVAYPLFSAEDIKDVYVTDGVAVIDWHAGFSQKLRNFLSGDYSFEASRRESIFLYGIVNTLTSMPMISSVWMLEDGKKLGTIGEIYLGNVLVRNPGLIAEE